MARNTVGYRNPPRETRFKKGRSGNPNGRPKGQLNLATELEEELKERITIREGGKSRRVSKQRGILKSLIAKGLQGDVRAMTAVLSLCARMAEGKPSDEPDLIGDQEREVLERYMPRILSSFKQGKKL